MPRRGALSPAAKAAISEGLRRYYMGRGQGGAKTAAIRGATRTYQAKRTEERRALRGNTDPRAQRRSGTNRRDRAVNTVNRLAELRAARLNQQRRAAAGVRDRERARQERQAGPRRQPPPRRRTP